LLEERFDPIVVPVHVDEHHHYIGLRSCSAWAIKDRGLAQNLIGLLQLPVLPL
jgi:hypothetical protein